jgi:hypothetical protein
MMLDRKLKLTVILFTLIFLLNFVGADVLAKTLDRQRLVQAQTQQNTWNPQKTWVFFVGLLSWEDSETFAPFPEENRRDEILLNVLRERGVPESQIVFLKDKEATTERIETEFDSFLQKPKADDWVFVYFSGHGFKSEDNLTTYFASYDAGKTDGWAVDSITAAINRHFKGSTAILAGDNCFSGALAESVRASKSKISFAVLTSAHFNSYSTANWTFTESLIYAFRGDSFIDDDADGKVTFAELESNSAEDMLFAEEQLVEFAYTGTFDKQTIISDAKPKTSPRIGDRVEAYSQDGWYKGLIIDASNDKFKIRYYGYEDTDQEWVTENQIRQTKPKQFMVGSKVEVKTKGIWQPAKILSVKGGAHYVAYVGYGQEWNEWVSSRQVRDVQGRPRKSRAKTR